MKKPNLTTKAAKALETINLEAGDYFATVTIWETKGGLSTEWWISSKFDWQLRIVGTMHLPLWGDNIADVRNRITFLLDSVISFIIENTYLSGRPAIQPQKSMKYDIAKRHIEFHMRKFPFTGNSERSFAAFKLAEEFGVNETAILIAEVLDMNVRTVHDWVYRMKQIEENR